MMSDDDAPAAPAGLAVRTYFVRGRNALLARADFSDLYVDYYLHQGQHGYQHVPAHDEMLKEALAAQTLHCASRPWAEVCAWTIHFEDPLMNLFVAGNNRIGTVVGQLFTENVREKGNNLFLSEVVSGTEAPRRSVVEFSGTDCFRATERYYDQSEQRPARYFRYGPEEFVMITAQPACDLDWLNALNDDAIRELDQNESLSLLETRSYRWECGCTQQRMLAALASVAGSDPGGFFGSDATLRMSCPRCGARHTITRETLEAYLENAGQQQS